MTPAERGAALARRRAAGGALERLATAQTLTADRRAARDAAAAQADTLRRAVKTGVQVVSAPQLFPTPVGLAARLAGLADIRPGMRVLEPSAGTGRLLDAIKAAEPAAIVASVEVSPTLSRQLHASGHGVLCRDFLQVAPSEIGVFDRIVMNPPFGNAQDIAHIRHALRFLKPGGRLVALCAAGSRQRAAFEHLGTWEDLPAGSFLSEGTGVRVAMLTVDA